MVKEHHGVSFIRVRRQCRLECKCPWMGVVGAEINIYWAFTICWAPSMLYFIKLLQQVLGVGVTFLVLQRRELRPTQLVSLAPMPWRHGYLLFSALALKSSNHKEIRSKVSKMTAIVEVVQPCLLLGSLWEVRKPMFFTSYRGEIIMAQMTGQRI